MNSQYINHNNQSTVETVIAMFFKQPSEIKHMHMIGVVVVKNCVYLLDELHVYAPDNTIKVISSWSMSLLELFLGRRRLPKTKSIVYQYIRQ